VALDRELLVVMEYVHGESLSRLLRAANRQHVSVPPRIATAVLSQALYGLHAAHEATDERGEPLHIVHRDVSPQNVVVGSDGAARVVDFGVAKAAGRLQETREGQLKGKIRYMAPEQLKRGPVDRRADVYAAGVVAWESLAGKRLFEGENEWQIATSIMEGVGEPPSTYNDAVTPELDAVILKALSVDPDARYATAFEMAAALEETVSPATAREVSKWVHEIAKEALVLRSAKLKAIEGMSADLPVAARLSVSDASEPSFPHTTDSLSLPERGARNSRPDEETATQATDASVISMARSTDLARDARRRRNMILVASVVGLLFVVGVAGALVGGDDEASPTLGTSAVTPGASAVPTASEVSAAPVQPSAEPSPQASAALAAPSALVPSTAATARKQAPRPIGQGKLAPWPEKAQKPPQCNPPYFFDKSGVKHLKKECF
jgi:serine/threonine-protein kinase